MKPPYNFEQMNSRREDNNGRANDERNGFPNNDLTSIIGLMAFLMFPLISMQRNQNNSQAIISYASRAVVPYDSRTIILHSNLESPQLSTTENRLIVSPRQNRSSRELRRQAVEEMPQVLTENFRDLAPPILRSAGIHSAILFQLITEIFAMDTWRIINLFALSELHVGFSSDSINYSPFFYSGVRQASEAFESRNLQSNYRSLPISASMPQRYGFDYIPRSLTPTLPVREHQYENAKLLEELASTPELEVIGYKAPIVPDRFICPISNQIIDQPVSPRASSDRLKTEYLQCGIHTFEKDDIERWLRIKKNNPVNRDPLTEDLLIPHNTLQLEIKSWLEEKRIEKIIACIFLKCSTLSEEERSQLTTTYYAQNFSLIPYASREMIVYANSIESFIDTKAILCLLLVNLVAYTEMTIAPSREERYFPESDRITELSEEELAGFQSNSLFAFDDNQAGNLSSNIANNKR